MQNRTSGRSCPITGNDVRQKYLREHHTADTLSSSTDPDSLFRLHGQEIYALAYSRRRNAADADELLNETFLRLLQKYSEGEIILNPPAWLKRVCINLSEDFRKNAYNRRRENVKANELDNVESREPSPSDAYSCSEQHTKLQDALLELPIELRTPLVMYYFDRMKIVTISEATGVAPATVHRRIQRAKKQLKILLPTWCDNNCPGPPCPSYRCGPSPSGR